MQSRREQRTVKHSVAKLSKQCNDQLKEVGQQIGSVVGSIGDLKINMENTAETMSKNVEELANSIPVIVQKYIDKKGIYISSTLITSCF